VQESVYFGIIYAAIRLSEGSIEKATKPVVSDSSNTHFLKTYVYPEFLFSESIVKYGKQCLYGLAFGSHLGIDFLIQECYWV